MDSPSAPEDALSPLEERRARLRAFSDEIMDAIRALPKPQSYLEGDRAMRCIATSDRLVVQLFSKLRAPAPMRSAPRPFVQPHPMPEPAFVYDYDDEVEDEDEDVVTGEGAQALDAVLDALETAPAYPAPVPRLVTPKPVSQPGRATALDRNYGKLAQVMLESRDALRELSP